MGLQSLKCGFESRPGFLHSPVMELVDMTYLGCVFCGFESHQGYSPSSSGQDNVLSIRRHGFDSRRRSCWCSSVVEHLPEK